MMNRIHGRHGSQVGSSSNSTHRSGSLDEPAFLSTLRLGSFHDVLLLKGMTTIRVARSMMAVTKRFMVVPVVEVSFR